MTDYIVRLILKDTFASAPCSYESDVFPEVDDEIEVTDPNGEKRRARVQAVRRVGSGLIIEAEET